MTHVISNDADIIDSRDIIDRIAELEAERDGFVCQCEPGALDEDNCECDGTEWATANPDDAAELAALTALAEEAEGYAADWKYGETLIRDSYFEQYARELLVDCGYIPADLPGFIEIDWDATASNVQQDYTSVDFDGVTYWVR